MKKILHFNIKAILFLLVFASNQFMASAQENDTIDIQKMTKEEVLQMSYDDLLALPFEDLIKLAEVVGVSTEELLQMILNMDVTTASKKMESVFESPLSTTVLTGDQIINSGATTIEEALRLVPGLIVRQKTNGVYDVHIRGNDNLPPGNFSHFTENTLTLVMIDGRIVYNYINGGTFWETLPVSLTDIERIDVVRGPSSALYGPNAVTGVINIITKKPASNEMTANVDVQAGGFNTQVSNITLMQKFNKFGYKVTGNYEYRNRFDQKYYSFADEEYLRDTAITSVFGYSYFRDGTTLPKPHLAKNRYSGSFSLYYQPNLDVDLKLTAGAQNSEMQTIFFENLATPFSNRTSELLFGDFNAKLYGFNLHSSFNAGTQDLSIGMYKPVIKYDLNTFDVNLDYLWEFQNLSVRPGFNYQQATYDDSKWREATGYSDYDSIGLLNGSHGISTTGLSLRMDYIAFNRLRLIGAVRNDFYNAPEDSYLSYQFVTSFKINEDHILRAVYSRANRSAFIGSIYSNFKNPLGPQGIVDLTYIMDPTGTNPNPFLSYINASNYYQYYIGNEEIKLPTMDLIEFGIRNKITDYLQTDIEAFYTKLVDIEALVRDTIITEPVGFDPTTPNYPTLYVDMHEYRSFQNLDLESHQIGVSADISVQPVKNMIFRVFGTYQQTDLKNWAPKVDENIDSVIDRENDWTPSYYGGFSLNYIPLKKVNLFLSGYYFSEQKYERYQSPLGEIASTVIMPKTVLNGKISYMINDKASVYFNARNFLNAKGREFGFADHIYGLYLVGFHVNI